MKKIKIDKHHVSIYHNKVWYSICWHWQDWPIFGIINRQKTSKPCFSYGLIIFGLWLYLFIDK